MYPESKLVQKCLKQIETKLDWGDSRAWHNDVFLELSERIQKHTRVLLSPTTLKRVWGRLDYQSAPSSTTLNTLAQFAGFLNWRDFKNKSSSKKSTLLSNKLSPNLGIIMLSASIMTIVFISFYSLKGPNNTIEIDSSKIEFSSNPITTGLPNSVLFNVELDEVRSDSIYIQQYWDPTKTIKLQEGQKQATGQYYFPGYFRAKLLVDGKVLKQHDLFIKTEGWLATLDYQPIPKYVQQRDIFNGKLALSPSLVEEIKSNERPLSSTFHKVGDFNEVSGDNFILQSTIKNTYRDKWAVCQKAAIIILGTKSSLVINFSIPGCVSEIGVMMSDVYLGGKENDLSGLGLDLTKPSSIEIRVDEKTVRVYYKNEEVFSGSYNESVGNIAGLRYRFTGAGEVSYIKLTDLPGQSVLLEEGFGQITNLPIN